MALPAILASILGQTAAGLPKGLHEADVLADQAAGRAQQDATRTQQQSQFEAQQQRMDSQFREQQDRIVSMEGARLAERQGERDAARGDVLRKESQERDALASLSGILQGQAQTMPSAGPAAEHDMPTVTDPRLHALSKIIPTLTRAEASKAVTEHFAPPKPEGLKERDPAKELWQDGVMISPATPQPPKASGSVYSRADIENQLALEGVPPNTLEWQRRYNDMARQFPVGEGARVVGIGSREPIAEGPPKTQPLPAGEAGNLADARTLLGQLDLAEQMYNPEFVGPVRGRLGALKQATGIGVTDNEIDLRTLVSSFRNQLLRLRSGAAVTPQEYERIKNELPDVNDPPQVFARKLGVAKTLLAAAIKNREAEFGQRGFRGGQAPAPQGESLSRRDPRYQKARQRGLTDQQIQTQFGLTLTD